MGITEHTKRVEAFKYQLDKKIQTAAQVIFLLQARGSTEHQVALAQAEFDTLKEIADLAEEEL